MDGVKQRPENGIHEVRSFQRGVIGRIRRIDLDFRFHGQVRDKGCGSLSILWVASSSRLDLPLCIWSGVCCLSSRALLQYPFADKGKAVVRRGRQSHRASGSEGGWVVVAEGRIL